MNDDSGSGGQEGPVLCPSAVCREGALLLGIVLPNGTVALTGDRIEVDEEFLQAAGQGRAPEKRFRFASPCARSGCSQWSGSRCRVIDQMEAVFAERTEPDRLRPCAIRPQCRWYGQSGARACAICPLVVTDTRVEDEASS